MDVRKLVEQMTLEEKAGMCSGDDFWHTKAVERLGIPRSMVSDGPHGLRKQDQAGDHLGINDSIKAVCFPAACATAASFDRDLIYKMGQAIGNECQAEDVSVILGPAANIKRSPLCGRNFEYFSEDPYLSSQMAASHIKGVQSKNVGTSLKHFIANNQEHRRMSSDSVMDERTLREIYLASFETAITEAKPWTVMCSYNQLNGIQVSENKKVMTDILRHELGFDGYVMSDWGAVRDRVKGLVAGLELEMPSSGGVNDQKIVEAVKNGTLDEKLLNQAVTRILNIVFQYEENRDKNAVWDMEADHALARRVEEECIVLLKNEDNILPLDGKSETAFIGLFADKPRYQGGGSSHINSFKTESALEAVKAKQDVLYATGYGIKEDIIDEKLIAEAVEAAKNTKTAVIFAGLPDNFESEGYDRTHMRMPECQNALIESVASVNPNTVVVLHNGSPVEMPWLDKVKAVLEVYLGGQAVGGATVGVLYGDVNPSGKLPESFPKKLSDNPSFLYYGGEKDNSEYREGVFVGYRYYDKKEIEVLFPFGHGLSYTRFAYSNLRLNKSAMKDDETLIVSVDVTNTGKVSGKEVVQFYVEDVESTVIRPVRELREFAKVSLEPGETKTVSVILGKRAFAYYNMEVSRFHVESGEFIIHAGSSSRDLRAKASVFVTTTEKIKIHYDENSLIGDIMAVPEALAVLQPLLDRYMENSELAATEDGAAGEAISAEMTDAMLRYMPLRQILSFANGITTHEEIEDYIEKLNQLD